MVTKPLITFLLFFLFPFQAQNQTQVQMLAQLTCYAMPDPDLRVDPQFDCIACCVLGPDSD